MIGFPLETVINALNRQGIAVEKIKYTGPARAADFCDDKRVVRIDEYKGGVVTLVVAFFPRFPGEIEKMHPAGDVEEKRH
ncbi:hypothetical protein [Thermoanaerobacterium sp. DL9XJH110]|uniref:hypothetical protein n=1 Tax=Thermoanaerobacterium sp. DL9XJH110 TaxID=3386643 RepID=UPI003BB6F338